MNLFAQKPLAPLEYTKRLWLRSWIAAVTIFLYAPLLVLFVFSFNDSKANVVWRGFTFKYYGKLFKNEGLMAALGCGFGGRCCGPTGRVTGTRPSSHC